MSAQVLPLMARVTRRIQSGTTIEQLAQTEGISLSLATLIVDELTREGLAGSAQSLCASGLGMCGGNDNEQARVHCAGCPLIALSSR